MRALVIASLAFLAACQCPTGQTWDPSLNICVPDGSGSTSGGGGSSAGSGSSSGGITQPTCDDQSVFDPAQNLCAWYPGGGYGWAGCSLNDSPNPPQSNVCYTGTHWDHCDCDCDTAGQQWNAAAKACQ